MTIKPFRPGIALAAAALLAACGEQPSQPTTDAGVVDAGVIPDAGNHETDAGTEPDAGMEPDAGLDPVTTEQITAVLAAADGEGLNLPVEGALVTYVKAPIDGASNSDPAGFFLQADQNGPTLFIAVDASTLTPAPQVGDKVNVVVTKLSTSGDARFAEIDASVFEVESKGNAVTGLVQDLSSSSDFVANLNDYTYELIKLNATISGAFASAGNPFVSAPITTTGYPTGDNDLKFRVPAALRDSLDLAEGCTIELVGTPLWRFRAGAQPSAWTAPDVQASCAAPKVVSAAALSATEVLVTFDRSIDPTTITASAFTVAPALAIPNATLNGKQVTLTTDSQAAGTQYTLTVAATVTDVLGTAVDTAADEATFSGYAPPPGRVIINEIDYDQDLAGGDTAEFIELYNPGSTPVSLVDVELIFVNGNNAMTPAEYKTNFENARISLTGAVALAPGEYLVIGSPTVIAALPTTVDATKRITFKVAKDAIQNGDRDAVALVSTVGGVSTVLDTISYEDGTATGLVFNGLALREGGSTSTLTDTVANGEGSLSRIPNGFDNDSNDTNFVFSPQPTPGVVNAPPPSPAP